MSAFVDVRRASVAPADMAHSSCVSFPTAQTTTHERKATCGLVMMISPFWHVCQAQAPPLNRHLQTTSLDTNLTTPKSGTTERALAA